MITQAIIANLESYKKEVLKIEKEIYKYFVEVIGVIFECFGEKAPTWIWFSDDQSGETGSPDLSGSEVFYYWQIKGSHGGKDKAYFLRNKLMDKYQSEQLIEKYFSAIPTKFLFMTLGDIKKEVIAEIKVYEDQIKLNKQKEKEQTKLVKNTLKKAKAKLSKEELKLLGIDK